MEWNTNSPVWHPRYDALCEVELYSGERCLVKLKHPNPKYTRNAPDYWRREEDVPGKKRCISDDKVAKWRYV